MSGMKLTIYAPDELAGQVRDELGEANISGICQAALRDELERSRARAKLAEESGRIELWDGNHGIAFTGREVDSAPTGEWVAYVTPKGGVVIHVPGAISGAVSTYADFEEFADSEPRGGLLETVADALGEKYVEELDI
jgi:post-segregation antitoxin (ccd killing protein)